MSFDIIARGIGYSRKPFHYKREDNPDSDTFELISIISAVSKVKPTLKGVKEGLRDHVKDKIVPSVGGMTVDLVASLGNMELLAAIKTQVTMLAMHSRKREPYIFLTARESNIFSRDGYENIKYNFFTSGDPGTDFLRTIMPALKATNMNNFGVASQLLSVLVNYDEMLSRSDTPQIMIEISK